MSYATSQDGAPLKMLECHTADCPPDGPPLDVIRQFLDEEQAAGPVTPQAPHQQATHNLPDLLSQDEITAIPTHRKRRRVRLPNPFAPLGRRIVTWARGFQPSWRLSGALLLLALILVRPWLIPGVLALLLIVSAIAWLTLGPERSVELAVAAHARFARYFPAPAERIAKITGKVTARLGLSLSDTDQIDNVKMGEDPFDRLAQETRA